MSRQTRSRHQSEIDQVLAAAAAADTLDADDLRSVEDRDADRVGRAQAELLDVGAGVLTQAGRVHRRQAEIGDVQRQAVLALRALLQIAERHQRDHVAVRRAATHAEHVRELGDPQQRALVGEASEDRKPRSSDCE